MPKDQKIPVFSYSRRTAGRQRGSSGVPLCGGIKISFECLKRIKGDVKIHRRDGVLL